MSKMLGGNNVPIAKTNVAAADFRSQNRLRTRQFCKHFGKQTGEFFLGKGLHEIVKCPYLKAFERVIGRLVVKIRRQSVSVFRSSFAASMPLKPSM